MIACTGTVVRGHGVASGQGASPYPDGTIRLQAPFFAAHGIGLSGFHLATLNVSIDPLRWRLLRPDHQLVALEWTALHPPETFSLVRCTVQYRQQLYTGLVYHPHPETKIRHFQSSAILELLLPFIPGIGYGAQVEMRVDGQSIAFVTDDGHENQGVT